MDRTTLEKFGLEPIPEEKKSTRWYEYAIIQFSFSPNAGNFLVPALAVTAGGLSFGWALLCTVLGASLSFYIVSVMSQPGSKYGIPAQYAFRSFLGIKGAKYISSPLRAISLIYWFAVQTIGGALIIQVILKKLGGMAIPLLPITLFLSIFMSVLAIIGFEAVRKMTKYCLPIIILGGMVMLLLFMISPIDAFHFDQVWNSQQATNQVSSMIFYAGLAFVQYLGGAWSSSDLARYAKSDRDAHWGIMIGNILGYSFTAFIGIYAALATGNWNPYVAANDLTHSQLITSVIFLSAMVSMVLINMNNAYSGGFSLLNSFPSLGRIKSTMLFCLLGILLSCFPAVVDEAKQFISLLGVLVGPVIGVSIIEYVFIKKRTIDLFVLKGDYHYNRRAMILIILGTILALVLPRNWPSGTIIFAFVSVIYFLWSKHKEKAKLKSDFTY
ncbi:purine-cytosine permease family protein [Pseudoneobacillus sp. C159]